ncbi:MAG: multidrug efflux SMR transporter [Pirellulales bacterium]
MNWLILLAAIALEVAGTTSMKFSDGFTRLGPSVAMFAFYLGSLAMLTLALRTIDVSVAYAIWAGLGTALIALVGVAWFNEPGGWFKLVCIGVIIAGVVGLNLSGGAHGKSPVDERRGQDMRDVSGTTWQPAESPDATPQLLVTATEGHAT